MTGVAFSRELLYHSKCLGHHLGKSLGESIKSVTGPLKGDALVPRQAKAKPSALQHADHATRDLPVNVSSTRSFSRAEDLQKQGCLSSSTPCGAVGASLSEGSSKVMVGDAGQRCRGEERHGGLNRKYPSIREKPIKVLGLSKDMRVSLGSHFLGVRQFSSSTDGEDEPRQSSLDVGPSKPAGGSSFPNPDNAASYVLMSNIYADGNKWDEVKKINEMRLKARAWKKPGKAYVEIKAKVHEFIVGDRTHQETVNIYERLRKIKRHMNHIGYVPQVDLILENRSYVDPYKPR